MSLTDHTILITGAAGGLGSTAALALARQGATIILLDKKIPALESVYDRIVEAKGKEPILYPFDLAHASVQDFQELADKVRQHYGSLQGLLHSAVDTGINGPIAIQKTQDWGQSLNINLNAAFLLTRVLLPVMQLSPVEASVVFTSDSFARTGRAYTGAYGVAKIALEGLAAILADELESARKIRVNTLIPGPVNSPLRKRTHPGEIKENLPEMASLSELYVYLFDQQSQGITGQTIDARTFNQAETEQSNV